MGETNLVEFGDYDPDMAKQEQKQIDDDSGEILKIKEGRHRLRVLPPLKGQKTPFKTVFLHYIRVVGQSTPIVMTCPFRTPPKGKKRKCPICDEADTLMASGNPADRKSGYGLKAKRRVYANVVRKKKDEIDSEVQVWAFGVQIHEQLTAIRDDPDDPIDFTHPTEGFDIILTRKGSGIDSEYTAKLFRRPTQLAPTVQEMNDLITSQVDLEKYALLPSDEDLYKALDGERPDAKQLTDGKSRRSSKRDNRRSAQDDMNDDDDDELEGEIVDDDDV